jgi:hypothetical protein
MNMNNDWRDKGDISTHDTLLNFPFFQYMKYDLLVIVCSELTLKSIPAGFIMHPLRPMSASCKVPLADSLRAPPIIRLIDIS